MKNILLEATGAISDIIPKIDLLNDREKYLLHFPYFLPKQPIDRYVGLYLEYKSTDNIEGW